MQWSLEFSTLDVEDKWMYVEIFEHIHKNVIIVLNGYVCYCRKECNDVKEDERMTIIFGYKYKSFY